MGADMSFQSLLSLNSVALVHAKPDVASANPDGQNRGENRQRRKKPEEAQETVHPVPNTQGQITGKLIDTTA